MKQQFVIRGYHAFSEKDSYKDGCDSTITQYEFVLPKDWETSADNLTELIYDLFVTFGAKSNDQFLLDSCEENGRIDLQVMQRKPFNTSIPTQATIDKWVAGDIDMWLTTYTFEVEIVQTGMCLQELISKGVVV